MDVCFIDIRNLCGFLLVYLDILFIVFCYKIKGSFLVYKDIYIFFF